MMKRTASNVAWLAAVTHIVASFAMLLLLRRGLPGFPEAERLAYIHANRAAWIAGWTCWQIAAISLLALYVVLALRFGRTAPVLSGTALVVAAAGFAMDFASEARYIAILPELQGEAFAALDRELEVLIGYAANGLYTVAFALLVVAGWRELPKLALALAGPVAAAGVALAIASLRHDARLEVITSAILFPVFTLWIMVVAQWLRREPQ
ncbi:MAG TPA: hypothetical protein VF618_24850 [Thermoanaerobaculia bacterium]